MRFYDGGTNMSLSVVNVITYTLSNANAQIWWFIRQANGSYKVVVSGREHTYTGEDRLRDVITQVTVLERTI